MPALKPSAPADDIERMREQYDLRRRYLLGELRSMGLECFEPQGVLYVLQ
ncbi:MAG: hypothetical protein ACLVB4_06750 [Butyricicoccus sp.]